MAENNFIAPELKDQVAIITGGARELGKAMALRLAKAGAHIVIADWNDECGVETAEEIQKLGRRSLFLKTNVALRADVETCVNRTMEEFGQIDILVNDAGVAGKTAPIQDQAEADWDEVINIDLKGVYLFCHYVVPHMLKRKSGRIVNIASIAGKEGNPNMVAYSAAKGGVIALTKSIGKELATSGILVNAVAPAVFNTHNLDTLSQENIDYMRAKVPMDRFGVPNEIGALVHFLVSDMCTFSTGFCYDISGGRATY
jgi:2-dehydro-3-deoxy-L-rhamnonate dehydrogenase (NAD+)